MTYEQVYEQALADIRALRDPTDKPAPAPAPCPCGGDTAAYDRHIRAGEPTCPATRAATAARQRAYYNARKARP